MDAFHRTGFDGFIDALLGAPLGHDNVRLFSVLIKTEDLRTKFNTAFTPDTFFRVNVDFFTHLDFPPEIKAVITWLKIPKPNCCE
jgi:hypothetical protein